MNNRKSILLWSILFLGLSTANTAELTCAGKVRQVNYHAPDAFMLQLDGMDAPVFFCRPNATWSVPGTTYTTSAETCRTLVGVFMSAKALDKAFAVIYFDGADVPASCNSWGAWKSANVRYFLWAD